MYNEDRVIIFIVRSGAMEVEGKIRKIGNSLGVILPTKMLKDLCVDNGDTVYISLENNEIKIRNAAKKEEEDAFKQKVIAIIEEYLEK